MKANEKPLEAKLRKGVVRLGGLCLKLPAVYFTGIPDRLCLLPGGRVYFAETKSSGKDLSPRQVYVKNLLEGLGFRVFKVDSEEALAECLKSFNPIFNFEPPTRSKSFIVASSVEDRVSEIGLEALKAFNWKPAKLLTASEVVELESLTLCQLRLKQLGEELSDKDSAELKRLRSRLNLAL